MTVLTPAQVYTLARGAGFAPPMAAIMVAIAGPESGYRTDAVGDVGIQTGTWGPSVGLWQIRSIKADTGTGRPRDASRLKDPVFNASAAYSIYKSQGLGAWTAYSSGAYRSFLGKANAAAGTGGAAVPPVSSSPSSGTAGAQPVGLGPLEGWNPLAWPGQLLSRAAEGTADAVWAKVAPFLITWGFVVAGGTLVIIGTTLTAWPVAAKISGLPGGSK